MKCEKCGAELNKSANFCRVCGSQIILDSVKQNHSSNQNVSKSDELKKDLVVISSDEKLSSSNEIKKILDEMTPEEKKIDEPTMTIPSELINKYCKNIDNPVENNTEKNTAEKSNSEGETKIDREAVLELTNTEESLNGKIEDKKISDEVKTDNDNLDKENLEESETKEHSFDDLNVKEIGNTISENLDKINKLNNLKKDMENNNEIEIDKNVNNEKKVVENKELIFGDVSNNDKKHYGRYFLVFFIIMICLCAIGYLLYVLHSSRNELEKIGNEKNILQEEIDNIKNNTTSSKQSTNGVIFNGYKFSSITSDYSIIDDSLVIKRNDKTYRIKINKSISFESIKSKKETYKQQLVNEGYDVLSYGNKHVDENDYYVFIVSDKSLKKYLIAYTKLDNESVIAFIVSSNDNNVDYDLLSQTNIIISSISKTISESSNDLNVFIEKK